ncbi:MAG: LON peptidase substrate-binding domain-containing protein, partial [Candidatus Dormibacteria bacterium]
PGMVVPVRLDEPEIQAAVDAAQSVDRKVLIVPRPDGKYAAVGTIAVLEQVGRLPNGEKAAVVRGEGRAQIGSGVTGPGSALWVEATPVDETVTAPGKAAELAKEYKALVVGILQQRGAWQVVDSVQQITDPGQLADTAGWASYLDLDHKAQLLAEIDVIKRLELLIGWTREHVAEQEVSEKISNDVREGMEKTQREFLLRQQMEAIRKELGEGGDDVVGSYRERIEQAGMPENARKEAERELGRLERMSEQNPEHGWIRTFLDWMLDIPWNVRSDDNYDLNEARRILDEDHTGLADVKSRIIEFLAVRKLRQERGIPNDKKSGAILTLIGPPGTGKTSIGESVARALNREFVRLSLGGIRDEAEIRGHRRTYIGALPGRLV